MSQQELAKAAGIALGCFQKVERAKTNVGVPVLVRVPCVLGVPPGVLCHRRELPQVSEAGEEHGLISERLRGLSMHPVLLP
ncbi:helix-turn-helix transcriptional regulator [Sorangium sp. So ce321]|uniref:helix-turn-helix domain-containing protein n=1 Tax=Sorangium sp. So ce321 TaxID=3133300 RepID=UPI003F613770